MNTHYSAIASLLVASPAAAAFPAVVEESSAAPEVVEPVAVAPAPEAAAVGPM